MRPTAPQPKTEITMMTSVSPGEMIETSEIANSRNGTASSQSISRARMVSTTLPK